MEEDSVFYKIKELEKNILKNLSKPIANKKMKNTHISTPTQMRIVYYILNYIDKKEIYQKDIEKALNLSKATVSDVLNRMEKKGHIEKITNPNDARSKVIVLSKDVKGQFEVKRKRLKELEKKAEKNITKEELKSFSNVLNKMIENLEKEQE